MKTAEEWAKEAREFCRNDVGCICAAHCEEIAPIIRAAQRDAIEAAIEALPPNVASNTEWISAFDIGIDACRDAIRSVLPPAP